MNDFLQNLKDAAEKTLDEMRQPGGRLRCSCGKIFDPNTEGGTVSPSPYATPYCGDCIDEYYEPLDKSGEIG